MVTGGLPLAFWEPRMGPSAVFAQGDVIPRLHDPHGLYCETCVAGVIKVPSNFRLVTHDGSLPVITLVVVR